MMRAIRLAAALATSSALCFGCAGAHYEGVVHEEPVAKPSVLLIYDFAVNNDDLVGDVLGANFEPPPRTDEDHAIARQLTDSIVAKLREKGINASRAEDVRAVPKDALVLEGQFVTIQEGNRLARMAIGFGLGRQELRVQAQLYQWTGSELRRVKEADAGAHGDSMPGMAMPIAAGAVVTGAVILPVIVSGTMNVGQEVVGGLRPTTDRLAGVIADNLASFYRERGWL